MSTRMLTCAVKNYSASNWLEVSSQLDDLNLLQTWAYGEAKARTDVWRVERGVFEDDNGQIVGGYQALVRNLPIIGGGLVWINRGPLLVRNENANKPEILKEIYSLLRTLYVENQGMYLRVAPMHGAELHKGTSNEYHLHGYRSTGFSGWASSILNISRPLEEIRRNFKAKWRGHLNKGERGNLEILSDIDGDIIAEFLEGHARLLSERQFETSVSSEFLCVFQESLPIDGKMTAFLARYNGETVGSVLMATYGDYAEYLAGNTSPEGRRMNAGQVLLWHAIVEAKKRGLQKLDLGGMDDVLTPKGIYKFKEGLGGTPYRLAPEIEAGGDTIRGRLVRWRVNRARAGK
jgi:hypothetical protein